MTCRQGPETTHYKGCDCWEEARDMRIAELEAQLISTQEECISLKYDVVAKNSVIAQLTNTQPFAVKYEHKQYP